MSSMEGYTFSVIRLHIIVNFTAVKFTAVAVNQKRGLQNFLYIMSFHGEDIDQHCIAVNRVYNPVCPVDSTGPFATKVMLQRLRFSYAGEGMLRDVA